MFMFRLVCYLYDLQHDKHPRSMVHTLGYFFMLPNVCFPLFPVVDYKRFRYGHYDADAIEIYQRGVLWVVRGVVQLILYRFVYFHLAVDPAGVDGFGAFVQYSLGAFLLYLQVSGQFHLIVGMLLLFGFNLPETHHLYYLASSYTDFWRRINIYWKDFMMKVFYYPLQFRLRKLGPMPALLIATIVVFVLTWLLHMWQWFWIRGSILFELHDALFWGLLAMLVVGNAVWEMRHGRDRGLGRQIGGFYHALSVAFSTAATFITICILWSMWSSDSLRQWLSMVASTGYGFFAIVASIPLFHGAAKALATVGRRRSAAGAPPIRARITKMNVTLTGVKCTASLVLVLLLTHSAVIGGLPAQSANAIDVVVNGGVSFDDRVRLEIGYYEDLVAGDRHNGELQSLYAKRPPDWGKFAGDIRTRAFVDHSYVPGSNGEFKGALVEINRWGMRDRDYQLLKPQDTVRIALQGTSHVFGSGVDNASTFESIIERRLNERAGDTGAVRYELLNFARGGMVPVHQPYILKDVVLEFRPDILVYVGHWQDATRVAQRLARYVKRGVELPSPIADFVEKAGVSADMDLFSIEQRLRPFGEAMLRWAYRDMVQTCRAHGITPVYVLLPMTYQHLTSKNVSEDMMIAREEGFVPISLAGVYGEYRTKDLEIAPWDDHPNALGHRLIAEALIRELDGLQSNSSITPRSPHRPPR
jgi:D-alanyl-lipoteichoic acid acyltransferase DltB (MBOAT superfamily)